MFGTKVLSKESLGFKSFEFKSDFPLVSFSQLLKATTNSNDNTGRYIRFKISGQCLYSDSLYRQNKRCKK